MPVKDPIEFVGTLKQNRTKRQSINMTMNEPLFFVGKYTDEYRRWRQLCFKYRETSLWMISRSTDGAVVFNWEGNDVTAECFVSSLKEIYPEYFEWLLFHQEWL